MPNTSKVSTVWRENRQKRGTQPDPQKRRKADRMRWYRAKKASFKKANDIFVDGLDTGCDRRVYVLVMNTKQSQVHYATYDSHPEKDWIPNVETVINHWPRPELWTPSNFGDTQQKKEAIKAKSRPSRVMKVPNRVMKVSQPPIFKL
ncbi:hypothetical protein N7449_006231 [Penicillium cf. viridicatum]|uniref:Uncharacterized protein n=1 Tax=Penicillium cf. viridicatum TaxID=2972119 RepID=A0A9W9JG76_9EURO|nr:hypothetical protein N7449_006231 [Penicillium cf. viridicatum]